MSLKHATIAANRFGLGATPGLINEIKSDPQGWLVEQLKPDAPYPAPIAALPSTFDDMTAFTRVVRKARSAGAAMPGNAMQGAGMSEKQRRDVRENTRQDAQQRAPESMDGQMQSTAQILRPLFIRNLRAANARFDAAVGSTLPYRERLVHFWSNHFVVSAAKGAAIAMPPSYERDVARDHVVGNFHDMLVTSSKHPAMLFYLDNYTSIGPNSKWGKSPGMVPFFNPVVGIPEGLNENLAREILELHTVGVNGGYSQTDVTSFARILTGWGAPQAGRGRGIRGFAEGNLFNFNPDAHEPGAHQVMGKTYAEGGVEQGEAVLKDLAAHDETANFIATKLVRHFVADDPPPKAIKKVATVFKDSDGNLREVAIALTQLDESWQAPLSKWKRPEEFLISAVRASGGPEMTPQELGGTLREMGQRTFFQPGPDGWPDVAQAWFGPDPLWKRLEWASNAALKVANTKVNLANLAEDVLGAALSRETLRAIQGAESPAQGLTILLTSPEFQRR